MPLVVTHIIATTHVSSRDMNEPCCKRKKSQTWCKEEHVPTRQQSNDDVNVCTCTLYSEHIYTMGYFSRDQQNDNLRCRTYIFNAEQNVKLWTN